MTPERWAEAKRLFAEASAHTADERDAFLAHACAGDAEMHAEVASLLAAAEGADSLPAARAAIAAASRAVGRVPLRGAAPAPASDAALQSLLEQALGQQYEIVRPLGHGGMGAVYLARERSLDRFVAIKVLRPDLAGEHASRERFRREARIAAQLSHPGILPLHTFGEVGGVWYFVMGYVRGVSLAERLRAEGPLPPDEARRILFELAEALECAHRGGVIHRDIKPANVLLDDEAGRAMLADFGIAKVEGMTDALTATGMVVGTPSFMSPEQALGAPADERSDIYSLGAVGYAMLAGREPFAGLATLERTRRRLALDAAPLREVAPHVPAALAEIVMRCLSREPQARWPTARAVRLALARLDDESAQVPHALRELPAFGPYALLWSAFWLTIAAQPNRSLGDRALLALVGAVVPVGLVMHVRNVAGEGMTRAEVARAAFWPPEWWGMWWPCALRRPTDLWPRLPVPARAARLALSAFLIALPAMILGRQWAEALAGGSAPPGWFDVLERALIAVCAAVLVGAFVWSRARGLSSAQAARFLLGATSPGGGWSDAPIERLLVPSADIAAPPRDSAVEHRRAIERLLEPRRTAEVLATLAQVRRTAEEVEACDAELAALSHDASTGEMDRLSAQLAVLERDADTVEGRRELAGLVRRQLEVLRRMRVRADEVAERRASLMRTLRAAWREAAGTSHAGDSQ